MCCSVLQCVAVRCSVLSWIYAEARHIALFQCVAVCCSVLQCVAVCCSVLQCVAVCCRGYAEARHIALFLGLHSSIKDIRERSHPQMWHTSSNMWHKSYLALFFCLEQLIASAQFWHVFFSTWFNGTLHLELTKNNQNNPKKSSLLLVILTCLPFHSVLRVENMLLFNITFSLPLDWIVSQNKHYQTRYICVYLYVYIYTFIHIYMLKYPKTSQIKPNICVFIFILYIHTHIYVNMYIHV